MEMWICGWRVRLQQGRARRQLFQSSGNISAAPAYLLCLPACLPACLLACLLACLPACLLPSQNSLAPRAPVRTLACLLACPLDLRNHLSTPSTEASFHSLISYFILFFPFYLFWLVWSIVIGASRSFGSDRFIKAGWIPRFLASLVFIDDTKMLRNYSSIEVRWQVPF